MLSKIPFKYENISKERKDLQLLRAAMLAELDAINLYEQMADMTDDKDLQKVFLDVAKEEKEHVGEFETLLLNRDSEQVEEMESGKKEVEEMIESN